MAKKIVRGITDVKTITNQDFDTNNVNDLLSDGQYNYIHRKKGENEEYHNLTDNIKTLSSDNTELLSVTNNNKTTNTATLHPKHDAQKEQVLESTRDTITINHGSNGTAEKTTVDTNPKKVLEHENLLTHYGISKTTSQSTTKLSVEYTLVPDGFDLNTLGNGRVKSGNFVNAPQDKTFFFVTSYIAGGNVIQEAIKLFSETNVKYKRQKTTATGNVWTEWREQVTEKSLIDAQLSQKEQLLESTRDTITIHHGTNGTAEKTTVDTNPKKVLEHENLISDSEYITLQHQTDENTTHIQTAALKQELTNLHQTKQDTLVAGSGITIQGQTISATGGSVPIEGASVSIQDFAGNGFNAWKHVVTSGGKTLVTFSFQCNQAETVITGALKQQLENFIPPSATVSNGAITITNDGTTMKLINSAPSENVYQQGTFTFYQSSAPSPK